MKKEEKEEKKFYSVPGPHLNTMFSKGFLGGGEADNLNVFLPIFHGFKF